MNTRKLLSLTRKALTDFQMIKENDKLAVSLSGGKDSMTLLTALSKLRHFYQHPFEMIAVFVDVGTNVDYQEIADYCEAIKVPFHVVKTDIKEVVFDIRKEKNPCSLCSKMKKGALNSFVKNLGFHKIALGHTKDDFLESFLMSLFYEGRIHCFKPYTHWDRMDLYAIRPLFYITEEAIKHYIKTEQIPIISSGCPVDGFTKRQDAKELLKKLSADYPNLESKLFHAIVDFQSMKGSDHEKR